MNFIQRDTKRCILAGSILILGCFAGYFQALSEHAYDSLFQERLRSVERDVDYICGTLDHLVTTDEHWNPAKYLSAISFVTERVDETPNVYAELLDENFVTLSTRIIPDDDKWRFDKNNHPEFLELLKSEETGHFVLMSDPFDALFRPAPSVSVYLYWRWIPTGAHHDGRVLFVVGVTKHSVDTNLADWVSWCTALLFIVTAIFIVGSMMFLSVDRRRTGRQVDQCRRI